MSNVNSEDLPPPGMRLFRSMPNVQGNTTPLSNTSIVRTTTDGDGQDLPPPGLGLIRPDSDSREDTPPPGMNSARPDPDDREDLPPPGMGLVSTPKQAQLEDETLHSDDEADGKGHGNSNTSSVQTTPDHSGILQRAPRNIDRDNSTGLFENSVLTCQLALLAALATEMQNSVGKLERTHLKTRIQQADQIFRMVQYEAHEW